MPRVPEESNLQTRSGLRIYRISTKIYNKPNKTKKLPKSKNYNYR